MRFGEIYISLIFYCIDLFSQDIDNHQLYTREIIELSHDVAFLLLLPPSDKICAVPGQLCSMQGDTIFTSLPLPTFELRKIVCLLC